MKYFKKLVYYFFKLKYTLFKKSKIGSNFIVGNNVNIDYKFKCGHYVYIGQNSYIGKNTTLGNFVMISDMVNIIGSDHVFDIIGTPIILSGKPKEQPSTIIGTDVWIGHGVTIMRGVKIGDGAIIGANSVVTKDIEAYTINVGIPCKVKGYRFSSKKDTQKHITEINNKVNIL